MTADKVVEIARSRAGRPPGELLEQAYRASCHEPVVLVLNGIDRRSVDRLLDPLVPTLPLGIPGVLYVDLACEEAVEAAVRSASTIYATTGAFRSRVCRLGIPASRIVWLGVPRAGRRTPASETGTDNRLEPFALWPIHESTVPILTGGPA